MARNHYFSARRWALLYAIYDYRLAHPEISPRSLSIANDIPLACIYGESARIAAGKAPVAREAVAGISVEVRLPPHIRKAGARSSCLWKDSPQTGAQTLQRNGAG